MSPADRLCLVAAAQHITQVLGDPGSGWQTTGLSFGAFDIGVVVGVDVIGHLPAI